MLTLIYLLKRNWLTALILLALTSTPATALADDDAPRVYYRTVQIDGLDIFYREAGKRENPTVLLLHGFPTSSHMYRDLIPALSKNYHVVAPDYPGYGNSSMPSVDEFEYSFDNMAMLIEAFTHKLELTSYSIYLMDYGAPIGFRLAAKYPEKVETLIIQNGNAYMEGIDNDFWEPIRAYWKDRDAFDKGLDNPWWSNVKAAHNKTEMANEDALRFLLTFGATQWQYKNGARDPEAISPDNWTVDQRLLDRPGNQEIQLQMFYSYGTNPPLYPSWQAYFRKHQPPTLLIWGEKDEIFPAAGAYPYKRDLKNLEFHLFDTGHFALEEDGGQMYELMEDFLERNTKTPKSKKQK